MKITNGRLTSTILTQMLLFSALTGPVHASPQWARNFVVPGAGSDILAMTTFESGGATRMIVAGAFTQMSGVSASRIVQWDGHQWAGLGTGLTGGAVYALAVFDDDGGGPNPPALFAGGEFTNAGGVTVRGLAKWNGTSWADVGGGVGTAFSFHVYSLAVYDDGAGPALYVGGQFASAGGIPCNNIARWNGTSWSTLGSGVHDFGSSAQVSAMTVYNVGSGLQLFVGGYFLQAGGNSALSVASWNGSSWSAVGAGFGTGSSNVQALIGFDDGGGPALYAGGNFNQSGGTSMVSVARWRGASWEAVGSGFNDFVKSFAVFDDGQGARLFAGGVFTTSGATSVMRIAMWDSANWQPVGPPTVGSLNAMVVYDDGTCSALFVGGTSQRIVAKWNGESWYVPPASVTRYVNALAAFDDGQGEALFVGGDFAVGNGSLANYVIKWDGKSWSPLGTPALNGTDLEVFALAVFDDGNGPALYVGGRFFRAVGMDVGYIARWNGTTWSAVGGGMNNTVYALKVFDDGNGPALFAGGSFTLAGGNPVNRIAKWNGVAWSAMGSGMDLTVRSLHVYDDGSGTRLYAGGLFAMAGGNSANAVAAWDGSNWSALGSGITVSAGIPRVHALMDFDDGAGSALYAVGIFHAAGGSPAANIARWKKNAWSAMGSGIDLVDFSSVDVRALCVHDDGSGSALYVTGRFNRVDGQVITDIARWNGTAWSTIGGGMNESSNTGHSMLVHDDGTGTGPGLFFGGDFTTVVPNISSRYIAKWSEPITPASAPLITDDPDDASVPPGEDVVLHGQAEGMGVIHYRWTRDNVPLADGGNVQGSGTATLTLMDVTPADGGEYALRVSNSCGLDQSKAASVTILVDCPADISPVRGGNQVVDIDDLVLVITSWGQPGGPADITSNGVVNIDDLVAVITSWGPCD